MITSEILLPLMYKALELASFAEGIGEVPVGAIVYSPLYGIIGEGYNCPISTNNPTAHAEIQAIEHACNTLQNYRLPDAILICTLEPCLMCFGASIHARVQGIVYGTTEPKSGAIKSLLSVNQTALNHRPWVISGILEEECRAIIHNFFKKKRNITKHTGHNTI